MKITQWSEDNCIRSFLEITHKEAESLIDYLQGQLKGCSPETLTHKIRVVVTDKSGKQKNTGSGLLTFAVFVDLEKSS